MHAFACFLFAVVGSTAAAYGPQPEVDFLCCPAYTDKKLCADPNGQTNTYLAGTPTCCSSGKWLCQYKDSEPVCSSQGLADSAVCPPAPKPSKCCTPRATPKMCSGPGYGAKVPAPCCADGKFRCSGCGDFGGESNTCKCCVSGDKPACGYGEGRAFCCNDGQWRCGSTSKVCKPHQGKGKTCKKPAPAKPKCCPYGGNKGMCDSGYNGAKSDATMCCSDGKWRCQTVGMASPVCIVNNLDISKACPAPILY